MYEINACDETLDIFPCTCAVMVGKIVVDCSGNGLRTVPATLPNQMSVLDFSDNLLQPDTIETLCNHGTIEHVSITGNHLTSIEPKRLRRCDVNGSIDFSRNPLNVVNKYTIYGLEFTPALYGLEAREFKENTFLDMFSLKNLDMITHQNQIPVNLFKKNHIVTLKMDITGATEIPEKLLSPLNMTLANVTIKSQSIQTVPAELLADLKTIKQFSLQVNNLHSIPSKFFQKQTLYKTVTNISLTGIKSLPRRVFWQLGHLRYLEIHETVDMPSDLFSRLLGLEALDLSESSINAIPNKWFHGLWHLRSLNLHNVGLSWLKKEHFKDLHALEKIDLSKNRLRSLGPMLFHHISGSAKFINISENILEKVPNNLFKQNATLEHLDISRNQISSIESEAFIHLSELKRLHLQRNEIYKLHAATFVDNVNMIYLDISSNILIDLPVGLLGSRHSLLVFNLSDNRINNLKRSIAFYGPTLREINFMNNPIECDCGIKNVKKLLPNALIIGYCENTQSGIAIVDFPNDNCSAESDAYSFITKIVSSNSTEWESKLIISANDAITRVTLNSILSTATPVSIYYPEIETSVLRINSTHSKNSSKPTRLNVLPITKYNVSDSSATFSISEKFTPTPVHNTSKSAIKKSTSVKVNDSRVDSDDNVLDINANEKSSDYRNTVSIEFTKPVESVRYKTEVSSAVVKPEPEINEGSISAITPSATLQTSFQTLKTDSSQADIHIYPTGYFETLHTKTVVTKYDASKSEFVELISPTSVYRTQTNDGQTMTGGFHNSSETFEYSPNATAIYPNLGYGNITNNPEMAGSEERSGYFYLSLGSIISVAVFSVLILVFLYFKRRRSDEFVMGTRRSANIYDIEDSFNEDDPVSPRESLCPLKEVPSIQIETVDDDGNVKLEYYIPPKNPS
jgi:Leucine-rich repeat (LRR) protein